MDEWIEALDQLKQPDKPPPGWISTTEFATARGINHSTASAKLSALVQAGRAESERFRVLRSGRIQLIPFYRLKLPLPKS